MSIHSCKYTGICVLLLAMTITACDSNDSDTTPTEEVSAMFTNVQSALTVALTAGFTGKTATPVVDCPQGGSVDVTNTGGTSSFNLSMDFDDCNGVDGSLSMTGSTTFNANQFIYNLTMSGQLEERCTLSYNNFQQTISSDLQGGNQSATLNGSFGATCGGGSVTCSFNNVALDLQGGNNASLFSNNCN